MENNNKNSLLVGLMWFLISFGIISFLSMWLWADVQVDACKLINNCSGGEGILQGMFIIFVSLPIILISTIVTAISFFIRKKKLMYISKSHRALLYTSITVIVILGFLKSGIFLGLFNYVRDGVELMFGI